VLFTHESPKDQAARAESVAQMRTPLHDLEMYLDDTFADVQKMHVSHRQRVLAQALPVNDPNAYPALIGKIYDPHAVRANGRSKFLATTARESFKSLRHHSGLTTLLLNSIPD
jgi:hypothetical protein